MKECLGATGGDSTAFATESDLGTTSEGRRGVNLVAGDSGDVWALSPWAPFLMRVQDRQIVADAPEILFAVTAIRRIDLALGCESFWRWNNGRFLKLNPRIWPSPKASVSRVLDHDGPSQGGCGCRSAGSDSSSGRDGKWTFVEVPPGRSDLTAVAAHPTQRTACG